MKVVVLTDIYPNNYGKSDGIFVRNQVKMMEKAGIQLDVIFIDLRSFRKKRKWGLEVYRDGETNIFHYSLPLGPVPFFLEFFHALLLKKVILHYIKKNGKPDILHGHFYLNGFWAKYFRNKFGIKSVLTEHSSELYREKVNCLHQKMMRRAYDNADTLISVSEALKKRMRLFTSNEIQVIPNALAEGFYYDDSCLLKPKTDFTFLFIGHVIKTKGIKLLIQSFEVMQGIYSNVRLIVVGNGNLLNEITLYAEAKHLNIKFMGEVPHIDIPSICKQCDCFVLPSEKETFGVSYIEAMSCGLPVIATKCGGPEEFVNETNGILIPVNDSEMLLKAMDKMYNSKNIYKAEMISKNIINTYGEKVLAEKIISVYESIM